MDLKYIIEYFNCNSFYSKPVLVNAYIVLMSFIYLDNGNIALYEIINCDSNGNVAKYILKKIRKNGVIDINRIYINEKTASEIFFMIMDLKINLSKKLGYKILSRISNKKSRILFCDLCKSYFRGVRYGWLEDLKGLDHEKREKWFMHEIKLHSRGIIKKRYEPKLPEIHSVSDHPIWNKDFPRKIIYSPMGGMNKKW